MKTFITTLILLANTALWAQNANVSQGKVFDGEPYLVINPNNSEHVVIAWMGWINLINQFKIKTKTSFDGGRTWSSSVELPHTVSGYSSADPCLAFDGQGNLFVSYIDFTGTTPPVTGGIYVCKSTDGGLNWSSPVEVISTDYDGTKWPIDRPWMVVDRSSGSSSGTIYVTSFNLNRTNPGFNPYLSISKNSGGSFTTKYVDTSGWLAGSLNPLPMCSPAVSSSGVFYGAYPSYVLSQNLYTQAFLASSDNTGKTLRHQKLITFNPPSKLENYPLAKKGTLLLCNPADADHLAYIYLSAVTGDLDIYLIESTNAGATWSSPVRVNDDAVSNNRMQDLIWGDFDQDGDLVISWRDRRNGADGSYKTASEIWAAYRHKDSAHFAPNFQITSQSVAYDSVLENAGNDFMCIKLLDDTLNATWGDTRNGKLNIWFQRMDTKGELVSVKKIASEKVPQSSLFPNPASNVLTIEGEGIRRAKVFDASGKCVLTKEYPVSAKNPQLQIEGLPKGQYVIKVHGEAGVYSERFIKQ